MKGTTYSWDYHYTGTQPHAPTTVGSRHFRYDANGNQLGWTETDIDNQSTTNSRRIYWDDKNRIQRINDDKYTSLFAYDDQDQRVVKYAKNNSANTAKTTYYINQYYQLSNDVLVTKHVFNGSSRLLTKHSGGAIVFRSKPRNTRSYKGRPESNLPGNYKAETHPNKKTDAVAPPLAGVKGKSAQAPGQQKKPEPAQNGKGKGQQGNNSQAKTNGHAGTAGLNGIAHRSDRANEVAQNTHKNPHLVALGLGEGADGATTGGDTGEATNPGQCDTINAGCTAGEAEDALYTGDEIVIIGDTKEQQFYYHPDHLGSTAYITDSRGQLTEHLEYFPFGETWVQEGGSKKTPYLYTGKELDQETGLYYYGARYYDPRVSVWASPDPILEKYLPTGDPEKDKNLPGMGGVFNTGNLGLYTYTHHNPVRYVDPDGNYVESAIDAVSLGFGIASFGDNVSEGNYWSAALDAVGIVLDGAALAVPIIPGGAGLGIKAIRGADAASVPSKVDDVIAETISGTGNISSQHTLSADELLEAGEQFIGPGYKEIGKPGSGVFRSEDGTRQFRIDNNSLDGNHAPGVPHGHLEVYDSGATKPKTNNHIPFEDN